MSLLKSPQIKLERAGSHIQDLRKVIQEFIHSRPYGKVEEPDSKVPANTVHKIVLTKPVPDAVYSLTADAVSNLRNALDNAGYALAVAGGIADPKNCAFPFAGTIANLTKSSIGRCKDLPAGIQSLFVGFQPYRDGDSLLWALNEICIADKHKAILPLGSAAIRTSASIRGTGYFSMPEPHKWNRDRNEMVLITLGPETKYDLDLQFRLHIAFNGIEFVDGRPVDAVVVELYNKVASMLETIDAEATRLGLQ